MSFLLDDEDLAPDIKPAPIAYKFGNEDTALGIINEMNRESSQVTDDDFSGRDIPDVETIEPEDETIITAGQKKRSERTAIFIVETVDQLISTGAAAYAKCDPEVLYADKEDIDKIAAHFGVYFAESNFDMPPWLMGLVVASFVLFDKFKHATELRKANIEIEAFKVKTTALEQRIELLEREKKEQQLKAQIASLETKLTA